MKRIFQALCCVPVLLMCSGMAFAQNYPTKPVKFISPYAPGSTVDTTLRPVAQKMSEMLGQQFVIDFKPANGGILGTDFVAKAPPDGYTLLTTGGSHTSIAAMQRSLPFDLVNDFAAVSPVSRSDQTLVVNPNVPAKTVKELVALAKARPGKLTYASNGGGTQFLGMELFKVAGGVDILHVPYKAGTPAMMDVVAGVCDMMIVGASLTIPLDKAGKMRILAVSSSKRSPWMPNIPTLMESGLPNFEAYALVAILAPAATPRPIINRLNGSLEKILATPDIKEFFNATQTEAWWLPPEQFSVWIREDIARWNGVAKSINFQPPQ